MGEERKIISFTVADHNNAKNPKGYKHYSELEFDDIPDIITDTGNYCACKLKDEYRLDENFEGHVDVLIIDVDDGCSINQAKYIFEKYEFYLITTKSHQRNKGGVVCDRFRMFFKLSETVHSREQMEEIYSRFIDAYPFIDKSCRNVSRFFYPSPSDAIIHHNKGREYPVGLTEIGLESKETVDPIPFHSGELKTLKWLGRTVKVLSDVEYDVEYDGEISEEAKLKGVETFLENEYYQGNKSNCLFQASSMMKRDGFDEDFIADYLIDYWQKHASRTDKMRDALQNIKSGIRRGDE